MNAHVHNQVPRRDSYEKCHVLLATIHPDIKRTLVAISERTGMTVSQVTDKVLFKGLIEMQELDAPGRPPSSIGPTLFYIK